MGNGMNLRGISPTIHFNDTTTGQKEASIYVNSNLLYILAHDDSNTDSHNSAGWDAVNGVWPFSVNLENNDVSIGERLAVGSHIQFGNSYFGPRINYYDSRFGVEIQAGEVRNKVGTASSTTWGEEDTAGNFTEKMRFNGNLGIGINAPTEKLHVAGNAIVTGTVTAQGSVLTSDRRLKKDIKPLKLGLKELVKVEGKTYNWKDESSSTDLQIGVIAQELEEIFPQLVDTTGEFKAVNYIGLVPIMVEAIKDLNTENRELKNLLKRLEARVNALEK